MIAFGSSTGSTIYYGSTPVNAMYVGSTQVYAGSTAPESGLIAGASKIAPIPTTDFTKSGNVYTRNGDGLTYWNQRILGDGIFAMQYKADMSEDGFYLNGANNYEPWAGFANYNSGIIHFDGQGVGVGALALQPKINDYIALRKIGNDIRISYTSDLGATWVDAYTFVNYPSHTYLVSVHSYSRKMYDPQGIGITSL